MADLGDLSTGSFDAADGVVIEYDTDGADSKSWNNSLSGTITVNGAAAVKRLVVLDRKTYEYVGSCLSNADGTWTIRSIAEKYATAKLMVIAFDDTGTYNAEIADSISPA